MTAKEKIRLEHRLSAVENRAKSNTRRLEAHHEIIEENSNLIGAIKEMAVETKYMREDLNKTVSRLDKLENKGGDKWDKFKWIVISAVVGIILAFLLKTAGIQ